MMYWPLYLGIGALVVGFLLAAIEDAISRDGGYSRRLREFMDQARRNGLSREEAAGDLLMREHLAALRREASDAVAADPVNWCAALSKAKSDAVERLAAERPDLAKAFTEIVISLSYGHLLYPAEASIVDRLMMGAAGDWKPNADQYAAVRIAR